MTITVAPCTGVAATNRRGRRSRTNPGGSLIPSCETDTGRAYPPRRITEVVQSFGEEGVLQSICAADFTFAVEQILDRVAYRMQHPG